METPSFIRRSAAIEIKTVDMHTTGEPTRIVYSGFPDLPGTLLEQRALARAEHDHIRRALICEPRGHREMYGAVLCPRTEFTSTGEAHMGVLFLTNEGYSTMCGHATLALGRLLVDNAGSGSSEIDALNSMKRLEFDSSKQEVQVSLHLPCGLVHVTVPAVETEPGRWKTDIVRSISYLSVPSYATGTSVTLYVPEMPPHTFPTVPDNSMPGHDAVKVDIAYGGAFYLIVPIESLGYANLASAKLKPLGEAATRLKDTFNSPRSLSLRQKYLKHPEHQDLQFLYGVIVTDSKQSDSPERMLDTDIGLCFFADQQVDRSPTGSGVQARVALAYAKGERQLGEKFTYHSPVSYSFGAEPFIGEAVEEVKVSEGLKGVVVKVSGRARYTGCCNFVVEENDRIGRGFWMDDLEAQGAKIKGDELKI